MVDDVSVVEAQPPGSSKTSVAATFLAAALHASVARRAAVRSRVLSGDFGHESASR